jgi:ABC-type polysaccharide/polyol phosphate export permease
MRRYGYLFSQLVRRELRQKYKGTVLGVLWYFVNPLVLMAVYGVMLGPVLGAVHEHDYAIFILAGLVVWLFFAQALVSASSSLVEQSSLVSKVRFPRGTVPAASVAVQLVPMFAMLVVLTPVTLALLGNASVSLLLIVPVLVCLLAFTLGLALIASVLHAYFRDVQPILTAALLPWFFISGVLFPLSSIHTLQAHRWAEDLLRWANPIAPFIDALRTVLYGGHTPSAATLLYVLAAGAISLGCGLAVFGRFERELAVVL